VQSIRKNAPELRAAICEVGFAKPPTNISAVAWKSLRAGDAVLIHWRTNVRCAKWVICRHSTASALPGQLAAINTVELDSNPGSGKNHQPDHTFDLATNDRTALGPQVTGNGPTNCISDMHQTSAHTRCQIGKTR